MIGRQSQVVLEAANRSALEAVDPFCLPMILATLSSAQVTDFRFANSAGVEISDNGISESLQKSKQHFSNHVSALARVFRFFSSETMVLLLISNRAFGNFLSLSTELRNAELNQVFVSISKKEIPEKFIGKSKAEYSSFQQWVSWCISSNRYWLEQSGQFQIVDLLVEEAELLSERGLVNSFKHCRPFSFGKGIELQVPDENGEFQSLNAGVDGLNWLRIKSTADALTLCYGTEELDFDADMKRLGAISILNDTLRTIRLAEARGQSSVELQLPAGFDLGAVPKRQTFEMRFPETRTKR